MNHSFLSNNKKTTLTTTIITINNQLNLKIITKKIKQKKQNNSLHQLKYKLKQNFLFTQPIKKNTLLQYLLKKTSTPIKIITSTTP